MLSMMVGPTDVPKVVLEAMMRPSISHRSPEYRKIHENVKKGLQTVFGTKEDVYILTSSGSGAMETAITNLFSPGDEVIVPVMGVFSKQFADMCDIFGLDTKRIEVEPNDAVTPEAIAELLTPNTKGVFVIHNESSTGVRNDLKAIGEVLKDHPALYITDAVSGFGGMPLEMDAWGLDVCLTGSQKALMAPAGLAFIALSKKAWEAYEKSSMPKFYFDLGKFRDFSDKNETPNTPAVYNMFALEKALELVAEEGIEQIYARQEENTRLLHEGVRKLGLDIFPKNDEIASRTLTAVVAKGRAKEIVAALADRDVIVNGGLPPFDEDVFRVGTMGFITNDNVREFLRQLEQVL